MTNADPPRDAAAVRLFPPAVLIATILAGIGLSRLWPIDLGWERAEPVLSKLGDGIVLAALGLLIWTLAILHRSGQDPNPWKPTPRLIESGPFRVSRNPIYLLMVLISIGFAIQRMDLWILALTPIGAWALQRFVILPEEAYLERKFGQPYRAYKRRVRRWI